MVASVRWVPRLVIVSIVIWCAARPVAAQPFSGRGGFGGGGGGDWMARMDRDGDGVLDPSELAQLPGPFRDSLRDSGLDLSRPISVSEFTEVTRQAFDRRRASGGGFGPPGGGDFRGRDGRDRGGDSGERSGSFDNRDGSSRSDDRRDFEQRGDGRGEGRRFDRQDSFRNDGSSDAKSSSKKLDKPAGFSFGSVTFKLPDQYRSKDRDGDGQIGLYEWPRSDYATFRKLDRDGDGFLTAVELIKAGGGKLPNAAIPSDIVVAASDSAAAKSSSSSPDDDRASTPRGANPGVALSIGDWPASDAAQSAPPAAGTNDELTRRAMGAFDNLDRDKNGQLSTEEWARSRTTRQQFERANAAMYPPISREQFVSQFLKVNPSFSR